ncbi:hypothetical protein Pst134EB_010680 [Puccinia striiformis f. sp. tritici]|nr:hypothetical protein Pst134EB_010680 [Puccinia striiformis f. sp. tritici]
MSSSIYRIQAVSQLNAATTDSADQSHAVAHEKRDEHAAPEGSQATPHDAQQLNASTPSSESGSETTANPHK